MEMNKFECCVRKCYVIISDLAVSLSSTILVNKPKKLDFIHQTVSRREARAGGHETMVGVG